MVRSLVRIALLLGLVAPVFATSPGATAIDATARKQVEEATVKLSAYLRIVEQGQEVERQAWDLGSGAIVDRTGRILTNFHVVDLGEQNRLQLRQAIDAYIEHENLQLQNRGQGQRQIELDPSRFLVFATWGGELAARYIARVVASDRDFDLAVLQIESHASGEPILPDTYIPHLILGDSNALSQGDNLHIFGYPASLGGVLHETSGIVGGFSFEPGIGGPAWINSDASGAGGNSGGTAVNDLGHLVGVPTLVACTGDRSAPGRQEVACAPDPNGALRIRPINLGNMLLDGRYTEPPESPPDVGPLTGVTALSGGHSMVVAPARDLLVRAAFEVPEGFPEIGGMGFQLIEPNAYRHCEVTVSFSGAVMHLHVSAPESIVDMNDASLERVEAYPGLVNQMSLRIRDGVTWLDVNGEKVGPFICPIWASPVTISVVAYGSPDAPAPHVPFEGFQYWELAPALIGH